MVGGRTSSRPARASGADGPRSSRLVLPSCSCLRVRCGSFFGAVSRSLRRGRETVRASRLAALLPRPHASPSSSSPGGRARARGSREVGSPAECSRPRVWCGPGRRSPRVEPQGVGQVRRSPLGGRRSPRVGQGAGSPAPQALRARGPQRPLGGCAGGDVAEAAGGSPAECSCLHVWCGPGRRSSALQAPRRARSAGPARPLGGRAGGDAAEAAGVRPRRRAAGAPRVPGPGSPCASGAAPVSERLPPPPRSLLPSLCPAQI